MLLSNLFKVLHRVVVSASPKAEITQEENHFLLRDERLLLRVEMDNPETVYLFTEPPIPSASTN